MYTGVPNQNIFCNISCNNVKNIYPHLVDFKYFVDNFLKSSKNIDEEQNMYMKLTNIFVTVVRSTRKT